MIPVITYHSVGPTSKISASDFEEHLKYLVRSGFRFHFAGEVPKLTEGRNSKSNKIVITVDDGYYDVFCHIFPLIKKYDVKITVFLITSRIGISDSSQLSPDDAHNLFINNGGRRGFLNIENILEMQGSGLVEFQSHSHNHLLHFSDNKIHSFYNPDLNHHWSLTYASPFPLETGIPLYALYPSLLKKRYFPSSEFSKGLCSEAQNILQSGNHSRRWKDVEKKLHKKALSLNSGRTFTDEHYESSEDRFKRVKDDLIKSRLSLEDILSRNVSALSWPWGIYTNNLAEIAKDSGYTITFSLQRKQQDGAESGVPRLVINKGDVDNLEKKLLISQSGLLKKITYSFGSPEKFFWSPQKS